MTDISARLEPLGGKMKIYVSPDYTFGTDAVLLCNFAAIRQKENACDLGTGCGIIPLLWCNGKTGAITAVEIQPQACFLLSQSIEYNCLSDKVTVINADLRFLYGKLKPGSFDLVTINPPYKPVGTGIESASAADKIARHETMCTLTDAVKAASRLLRFGGRFCLCHKPERLSDILYTMREYGVEAKRLRFVVKKHGCEPWLVLVEGKRGAKSHLKVEKDLAMYDEDGNATEELKSIYGEYKV